MGINPAQASNDRELIRLGQLNLGKGRAATNNLTNIIDECKIDICLIQEPNTRESAVVGFPLRYTVLAKNEPRPRSAIVIANRDCNFMLLNNASCELITVAEISIRNTKFYVASIYLPPVNRGFTDEELIARIRSAVSYIPARSRLLIGGDFNAKSPVWNSAEEDRRGRLITELIEEIGLTVVNTDSAPTFNGHRGSSHIDFTAASHEILDEIADWKVEDEETLSDHSLITWNITRPNARPKTTGHSGTPRFCNKKTDWAKFDASFAASIALLEEAARECRSPGDAEAAAEMLNNNILEACRTSMPLVKQFRGSVPWWTPELTRLRATARRLRRRSQRARAEDREDRQREYREAQEIYRDTMATTRTTKWQEFCSRNSEKDPWGTAYRVIRGKRTATAAPANTRKPDGSLCSTIEESIENLLSHFFPDDLEEGDNEVQAAIRASWGRGTGGPDGPIITRQEVERALRRMSPRKAPGHDGIPSDAALRAFTCAPELITTILNLCLEHATFPSIWKVHNVKFIPKHQKQDPTDPSSFRPISLLPVMGKVLDRVIATRVEHSVRENGGFSDRQFGFVGGRSTLDAIDTVVGRIKELRARGDYCVIVSVDISGAFDNAWWPLIGWELERIDFPNNWLALTKSYFSNRTAQVTANDGSITKRGVARGCPQGSCSGPAFWKLIHQGMFRERLPAGSEVFAYADDTLLLVHARQYKELKRLTNESLRILEIWAEDAKLNFSPSKTEAVFYGKTPRQQRPTFVLGGKRIHCTDTLQYLGVAIDYRLNWQPHIKAATDKGKRVAHRIGAAARLTWGFRGPTLARVYEAAVQPAILYAAPVWAEGCKTKQHKQLLSAQRFLAVKAARAYATVSTEAALIISEITPISLVIKEQKRRRDVYKARASPQLLNQLGIQDRPVERTVDMETVVAPFDPFQVCYTLEEDTAFEVRCYTDGSRMEDGRAGAAFVVRRQHDEIETRQIKLENGSTIFQCELLAIREALGYIRQNAHAYPQISIVTDSRSVLQALQNMKRPTELQVEVWTTLREASTLSQIKLHWTKSHQGNTGNERADELAKNAAESDAAPQFSTASRALIKKLLRGKSTQEWETRWSTATTGRLTAAYIPSVATRKEIATPLDSGMTQIITGHGNFQSYLKRFGFTNEDLCTCGAPDTAQHILLSCPNEAESRSRADLKLVKDGLRWPSTMEDVTGLATESEWWAALKDFTARVTKLSTGQREAQ